MTPGDTLAIVGDVHGDPYRLRRALRYLLSSDLTVVFVGDYVNRGPGSREVLDQLVEATGQFGDRLTLIRGNHDQVLLDFLSDGDPRPLTAHGGVSTVRSYLEEGQGAFEDFRAAFPADHLRLLESTVDYYESDDLLVTHAGFNPSNIESRSPYDVRGPGFGAIFNHAGPWPRPLTVCGHFIQSSRRPYLSDPLICIDTGCGSLDDGALTVLYLPSRQTEFF